MYVRAGYRPRMKNLTLVGHALVIRLVKYVSQKRNESNCKKESYNIYSLPYLNPRLVSIRLKYVHSVILVIFALLPADTKIMTIDIFRPTRVRFFHSLAKHQVMCVHDLCMSQYGVRVAVG